MEKLSYYFSDFVIGILTFNYFFIRKVIRNEIPKNIDKLKVLDFGCGTGVLAKMFAKNKYVGFDLDAKAISFAMVRHSGYRFKVGDATNFKIKNKFDLILVVGVLHHFNDLKIRKAALIISRLLKKNGIAIIIEATHPLVPYNFPGIILRKLDKGSFVRSVGEYAKLLKSSLVLKKQYQQKGGILDYAVLVADNKGN